MLYKLSLSLLQGSAMPEMVEMAAGMVPLVVGSQFPEVIKFSTDIQIFFYKNKKTTNRELSG